MIETPLNPVLPTLPAGEFNKPISSDIHRQNVLEENIRLQETIRKYEEKLKQLEASNRNGIAQAPKPVTTVIPPVSSTQTPAPATLVQNPFIPGLVANYSSASQVATYLPTNPFYMPETTRTQTVPTPAQVPAQAQAQARAPVKPYFNPFDDDHHPHPPSTPFDD